MCFEHKHGLARGLLVIHTQQVCKLRKSVVEGAQLHNMTRDIWGGCDGQIQEQTPIEDNLNIYRLLFVPGKSWHPHLQELTLTGNNSFRSARYSYSSLEWCSSCRFNSGEPYVPVPCLYLHSTRAQTSPAN